MACKLTLVPSARWFVLGIILIFISYRGIAAVGSKGILWWGGNINSGVTQVCLAWIFAPLIAAGFGAIIFTITKYSVMLRSNPVMNAFVAIPIYFGITSALLTSKSFRFKFGNEA